MAHKIDEFYPREESFAYEVPQRDAIDLGRNPSTLNDRIKALSIRVSYQTEQVRKNQATSRVTGEANIDDIYPESSRFSFEVRRGGVIIDLSKDPSTLNDRIKALSIRVDKQREQVRNNEAPSQVNSAASRALVSAIPDRVLFCLSERVRTQLDYKGAFARALLKIPEKQRINAIRYALCFRMDQGKIEELIRSVGGHWDQTALEANPLITQDIASPETMKIFREITKHTDAEIESVLPLSLKVTENIAEYSKNLHAEIPSEDQIEFDLLYSRTLCRNSIQTRIFKKILKIEAPKRDDLITDVNSAFERFETKSVDILQYRLAAAKPGGRGLEYIFWKDHLRMVRNLNKSERGAIGETVRLLKGAELKQDFQESQSLFKEMQKIAPKKRRSFVDAVLESITPEMSDVEKLNIIWGMINGKISQNGAKRGAIRETVRLLIRLLNGAGLKLDFHESLRLFKGMQDMDPEKLKSFVNAVLARTTPEMSGGEKLNIIWGMIWAMKTWDISQYGEESGAVRETARLLNGAGLKNPLFLWVSLRLFNGMQDIDPKKRGSFVDAVLERITPEMDGGEKLNIIRGMITFARKNWTQEGMQDMDPEKLKSFVNAVLARTTPEMDGGEKLNIIWGMKTPDISQYGEESGAVRETARLLNGAGLENPGFLWVSLRLFNGMQDIDPKKRGSFVDAVLERITPEMDGGEKLNIIRGMMTFARKNWTQA